MTNEHADVNISEEVQPLAGDIGPATWQRPAAEPVRHHAPSFDGQSLLQSMFSVIIIALFVITFLVQAFVIPSESMEKTLLIGDYLLVNKVPFNTAGPWGKVMPYRDIRRGDIIVFHYPVDPREHFVKRVIGIPGDHVRLRNKKVYVNDKLQALGLSGIGTIPSEQTVYEPSPVPGDSFAANLLGFVNAAGVGQYGLEGYYNSILSGTTGHESTLTDVNGNAIVLGRQQMVPAMNGDNLQLALDAQIQYYADLAIANGVNSSKATSGTLMIMDTKTGAIDAWAQYPSYNANSYASGNIADFRDLAVTQPYEPGSVMKVLTFAGGLNNNAFTPSTVIDEKQQRIDGYLIHDWDRRSHGNVSMQWVLDDSLNNGAIDAQKMEGQNAFYNNLLAFGIGAPTGIDLAGEANRPLAPASSWNDLKYAEASFGQGLVTTPVEMLAAVNAVANGGVWVQPHVVDAVVDPNTGKSTPFVPVTRRVISATAANTLAHMMVGVVNDTGGEGKRAKIPGYSMEIAGKTGTAQVALPNGGGYGPNVVASFVGFMPVTNPRFTMMVILNNPQVSAGNRFGSILAAPIWKQMAEMMINDWRIEP